MLELKCKVGDVSQAAFLPGHYTDVDGLNTPNKSILMALAHWQLINCEEKGIR